MAAAKLAEALKESFLGRHAAHVSNDRLEDDRGYLAAMLGEGFVQRIDVVVGEREGGLGESFRHAGRIRNTQRSQPRSGLYEKRVNVPVIVADKLDREVPAGIAASDAQGAHGCLGSGVHEAHAFDGRDDLGNQLGKLAFGLSRCPEARPPLERIPERVQD